MYYDRGECLALKTLLGDPEEVQEIVNRLYAVSHGCEVSELFVTVCGCVWLC